MNRRQFTTFYLGGSLFGIDIRQVREINRQVEVTAVHNVPDFVRGLMNLRGQIVTVLDFGVKLGFEKREIKKSSRIVMLKSMEELTHDAGNGFAEASGAEGGIIGLLVDRLGDVVETGDGDVEPPPANLGDLNTRFISGVVKLEDELLSLMDIFEILRD